MVSKPGARAFILHAGLPVALVILALGLTLLFQSVVSTAGFIFFYAAAVGSAWFGGKWSGALAVILGIVAVEYYFMAPIHSFGISRDALPVFLEFVASSTVAAWFSSWRRQAEKQLQEARNQLQTRVEERTAELRLTNERLLAEIAERKRAEGAYHEAQAELARVTRISAMGALAASISHEVNQPLAAVVTNADACAIWLGTEPPNLAEARAAVESIAREGTRASDVVRQIRAMFTKAKPERAAVNVNELIKQVALLMDAEAIRRQTVMQVDLAAGLPPTLGDRVQLQQVIMNLILNGIESMSSVSDRPRLLAVRSEEGGANDILVTVRDSGVGIDPHDMKRIFEAFYSTKAQGMGMGLSISHSIIEAHGGRLWVQANSDHGATFHVKLSAKPAL